MPLIEEDVRISPPLEEVFDYLTAAENLPVWDSSVIEAEQVTRARCRWELVGVV